MRKLSRRRLPDGYTLLLATSTTMSINPQVYPKLPYDALRDFAPITSATYVPFVIAAHPSVPANSMTELIALAKAKPGTIKYSTPGTASSNHVAGALLEAMAGIKLLHVPYKGSGPAATAALQGEVQFVITGIGTLVAALESGQAQASSRSAPTSAIRTGRIFRRPAKPGSRATRRERGSAW